MIIRDLKLDLVLSDKNTIINKFDEITKGLKVINTNVYEDQGQEYIFYNQNNEWIFYQDLKNDYFWCNYDFYWSIFEDELGLKYLEIQEISKYLAKEKLNIKVGKIMTNKVTPLLLVKESLKLKKEL